jgi:hypothetical protein
MKKVIILILLSILLFACNPTAYIEHMTEDWIAITDIDSSNLEMICKHQGESVFFVPDLSNTTEELILLDWGNKIELMNLDGTNRHAIIDTLGDISNFSVDRTKMLMTNNGDIYMANVDGTDLVNLTNTPDIGENFPAFSSDGEKIIFQQKSEGNAAIAVMYLNSNYIQVVYEFDISSRRYKSVSLNKPLFYNDDKIIFNLSLSFDANEENESRYELHMFNLLTSELSIIYDNESVYNYFFNKNSNYAFMATKNALLLNLENNQVEHNLQACSTLNSTINVFSKTGKYVYWNKVLFDIELTQNIDTNMNISDINSQETKVLGIYSREYGE